MTMRTILSSVFGVTCLATIAGVLAQQEQISHLRAEARSLQLHLTSKSGGAGLPVGLDSRVGNLAGGGLSKGGSPTVTGGQNATTQVERATHLRQAGWADARPSPELLELRSKVTLLMDQERALASVQREHDRLVAQLAARRTHRAHENVLPPDYIRASQARWEGMGTPENTVQSFLWAVRHHDRARLLRLLTPGAARQFSQQYRNGMDKNIDAMSRLPGLRIFHQTRLPDGSIKARWEFLPRKPMPPPVRFRLMGGEWKLDVIPWIP